MKTGSNRPVSVRSVRFFRAKTGSNWFGSVFSVWLGFLSSFFRIGFGFFSSRFKNRKQTELVGFFKILIGLIGFFSQFGFFGYLFSSFLGLISFLVFFNTPT
jgi:hypothetical protein